MHHYRRAQQREETKRSEISAHVESIKRVDMENKFFEHSQRYVEGPVRDDSMTAQKHLTERKAKLSILLQNENEIFAKKLIESTETSEQRMVRLQKEAQQLRDRKEAERMQMVTSKLAEKEELENDLLRLEKSKLSKIETAAFLLKQMEEGRKMKTTERETDKLVTAFLDDAERRRLMDRETLDSMKKIEKNREMSQILHDQIKLKLERKSREEIERRIDMEGELQRAKAAAEEADKESAIKKKEILEFSISNRKDELERKRLEKDQEKLENEKIISEIIAEEKLKLEAEIRSQIQQANRLRLFSETHAVDEQKRRENEVEKIQNAASEKEWDKKFLQYQKREDERRRMEYGVMETRRQQVADKSQLIQDRKNDRAEEKSRIDSEVASDVDYMEKEHNLKLEKQRQYRAELDLQNKSRVGFKQEDMAPTLPPPNDLVNTLKEKQKRIYNEKIMPRMQQSFE